MASASSLDVQFDISTKSSESEEIPELLQRSKVHKRRPKPKIKAPTTLERIFGNKNVVKDHLFTAGSKVNDDNQRNIFTEQSPFVYPKDLEEFSYRIMSKAWREILTKKELKYKHSERNNYRSRQQLDVLNRLYAKEPEIKNMQTILDIDPEFFSYVEGRPVEKSFGIRGYINNTREVLRTKVVTGYREDEIMLIEENLITEQKIIDEIKEQYQKYVNIFEDYLFEDHTASMQVLKISEQETAISNEKYEIYRELSKNYGALKASMYNLEETWRNFKMYQKFLYLVSPMEWRKIYDYYHLKHRYSGDTVKRDSSTVFGRYRLASSGDVLSLEELIEQYLDDCKIQEEPNLYFTEPWQLLKIFRFIELQNLNSLIHSEELAIPLENVNTGMMRAKETFDAEITTLQENIDNLEGGILWEEERAKNLEELALELINGEFKKVIADTEVLNMYVFVEDVYETRVAPNDTKLPISEMMKSLEVKYRQHLLKLDSLPQELVYKAESECYAEEARIMKIAILAAKKVVQIERLTRQLNIALGPPYVRTVKELKWRSPPLNPPVPKPPPPRPLTAEETQFLTFFTEYCKQTDEVEDYGININQEETKVEDTEKDDEKSSIQEE